MAHGDIEVTIFGGVDLSDSLIELFKFCDYNFVAEVQYRGSHYGIGYAVQATR